MFGDLSLKFGRVRSVDSLVRQMKRRGVNVEEHAVAHYRILPSRHAQFRSSRVPFPHALLESPVR